MVDKVSGSIDKIFDKAASGPQPDGVIDKVEEALYVLGLSTPLRRAIAGAAIGTAVMWSLRPGFSFREDRTAKSWALLDPEQDPEATYVPWWYVPLGMSLLGGVFI